MQFPLFLFLIPLAATTTSICPSLPKAYQLVGQYAGFAILHSDEIGVTPTPVSSSLGFNSGIHGLEGTTFDSNLFGASSQVRWQTRCNLFRATNRFWDTYVAKFELTNERHQEVAFTMRGIRPANSKVVYVRGALNGAFFPSNQGGLWDRLARFVLGGPNPQQVMEARDTDGRNDRDGAFDVDPTGHVDLPEDLPFDSTRCHVSGTLERFQHDLDEEGQGPPLESRAEYFVRPPDLTGRVALSYACGSPGVHAISFALRKFDISYFRGQQTRVGICVALKTCVELWIFATQYRRVYSQRAILKSSWVFLFMCILFDAFEAGFFFGRQSLGNDVSLLSPLALVGLLKCLLIVGYQLRWIIFLWKERSMRRRPAGAEADVGAWVKDMNKFIRLFAAALVVLMYITSRSFEVVPEIAMLAASLVLVPQIAHNIWSGTRHPLQVQFVIGVLVCRAMLPYLLWSSTAQELVAGGPSTYVIPSDQPLWPPWFAGVQAPPIPSTFKDSIFGHIPRRPNSLMLFLVTLLSVAQGVYLCLQNLWTPRLGIPGSIQLRYLPAVFDYELDVPRVAALKQQVDPELMGVDCVICMTAVKWADRDCVVTPCEHFYHRGCLMEWIEVKLECPTCRRSLPPM